jgi:hypothetical protein
MSGLPAPKYRRLACYDHVGLIGWCQGRRVMALTNDTSIIESVTGPFLTADTTNLRWGRLGDSLDEMGPYK